MRVAVLRRRVEIDLAQRLRHQRAAFLVGHFRPVDKQPLANDFSDRQARAERSVRVLEHDLHVVPHRPQLFPAQPVDALAEEYDGAFAGLQAQKAERKRCFA